MIEADNWIQADWPAPVTIHAGTTLRFGGVSQTPFDSFNLASHVGDHVGDVMTNRNRLIQLLDLPQQPVWLNQQHGTRVVNIDNNPLKPQADASFSTRRGIVCAVLTADCLPVLICDKQGKQIAAIHAGWRGLVNGIIEKTVSLFNSEQLYIWLGPAISQAAYEVGDEIRVAFLRQSGQAESAFIKGRAGKWHADLYQLARQRLKAIGVVDIYGGNFCTLTDQERFYSYRRTQQTGRMASLIWMN